MFTEGLVWGSGDVETQVIQIGLQGAWGGGVGVTKAELKPRPGNVL